MNDGSSHPRDFVEFGPFRFEKGLAKLTKGGTPIKLGGMPLKILSHLLSRPGELVTRGELQKLLWAGAAFGDFEQGLSSAVNVVRKTLNDSADQPRYIETIPGQGYRFIAPIRVAKKVQLDLRYWKIAGALLLAVVAGIAFWKFTYQRQDLMDGSKPSLSREANDQYNLAMNFLIFQNDIPLARKTFQRAIDLDANFSSARLQLASMQILEIFNGYSNDESVLYRVEELVHQVEPQLAANDGLLVGVQAMLTLAQGRLDQISAAKSDAWWRSGANDGLGPPTFVIILRMLRGQVEEPMAIGRQWLADHPLDNPTRMLLGELQRTQGDAAGAVQTLERVMQQAPNHMTPAWFLAMAHLDAGKPEKARALLAGLRSAFEKNYAWRHAWAILLASEGQREEAGLFMDAETLKFARLTWSVTSATADYYALQGDDAKAIEWLQLAVSRGDERVSYFLRNPRLRSLREDARVQSIFKSVQARRKP